MGRYEGYDPWPYTTAQAMIYVTLPCKLSSRTDCSEHTEIPYNSWKEPWFPAPFPFKRPTNMLEPHKNRALDAEFAIEFAT